MSWPANKVVRVEKARTMVSFHVVTPPSSLLSDTPCANSQLNKAITGPVCECHNVPDSLTRAGKPRKPKPVWGRLAPHFTEAANGVQPLLFSIRPTYFTLAFWSPLLLFWLRILPAGTSTDLGWAVQGTRSFIHSLNPKGINKHLLNHTTSLLL